MKNLMIENVILKPKYFDDVDNVDKSENNPWFGKKTYFINVRAGCDLMDDFIYDDEIKRDSDFDKIKEFMEKIQNVNL